MPTCAFSAFTRFVLGLSLLPLSVVISSRILQYVHIRIGLYSSAWFHRRINLKFWSIECLIWEREREFHLRVGLSLYEIPKWASWELYETLKTTAGPHLSPLGNHMVGWKHAVLSDSPTMAGCTGNQFQSGKLYLNSGQMIVWWYIGELLSSSKAGK